MNEDKVKLTVLITKEAADILRSKAIGFDGHSPGERGRGEFISELVTRRYSEILASRLQHGHMAAELAKLADLLDTTAHDRAMVAAKLVRLAADLLSE